MPVDVEYMVAMAGKRMGIAYARAQTRGPAHPDVLTALRETLELADELARNGFHHSQATAVRAIAENTAAELGVTVSGTEAYDVIDGDATEVQPSPPMIEGPPA